MATAYVEVQASAGESFVTVLLDVDDFLRLNGRAISIGSHGYPQVWADRRMQTLHRWLLGLTGSGYRVIGDHDNRDRLDNRRGNLRPVDGSVSNANRPQADGPYVGVFQVRSGRYQAHFRWRRVRHYLGTFDDRDTAAAALQEYRRVHCPDSLREAA